MMFQVPRHGSIGRMFAACLGGFTLFMPPNATAVLPVSGWPVPTLASFDDAMQQFMADHNLSVGVLAVSKDGMIIYQRGFGYLTFFPSTINLPENTPMRIASCSKPLTSAAIRQLVDANEIPNGWGAKIFDLGQPGGGILQNTPFNGIGDQRLKNVTVQDAFDHEGGWDIDTMPNPFTHPPNQPGMDPVFESINIANAMGVASPAGRDNEIRFMLSRPLQFPPGTPGCLDDNNNPVGCYSNFGYMLLGRVIETVTGLNTINYLRQNVLTPNMWVPSTELFNGRTFSADQNPREPFYSSSSTCSNVYDPNGLAVSCPYGGWDMEAFVGFGNLVASAAPLAVYMDHYWVQVGGPAGTPLNGGGGGGIHNGGLDGTSTTMWQRGDNINIVVLFNARPNGEDLAYELGQVISDQIDGMVFNHYNWPTRAVDGSWIDFSAVTTHQVGGYSAPFHDMPTALANITNGTKLRIKPGTTTWSGTLSKKLLIDAPQGTARIGG